MSVITDEEKLLDWLVQSGLKGRIFGGSFNKKTLKKDEESDTYYFEENKKFGIGLVREINFGDDAEYTISI